MTYALAIFAGAALAVPYLLYVRRARDRRRVFAIGLIVAASVYIAFAAAGGTFKDLLIELSGVGLFGILAFLGVRYSAYILALGWVAHVGWDLLLHPVAISSYAPWCGST